MKRLFVVAAIVTSACGPATLEPLPLLISLEAAPASATAGDTVFVTATVQGNSLLGLEADYGDGSGDTFGTAGARTGKVTFRHPFPARGIYTVKITVTDGNATQKTASIDVRIL